jgi:hypothetical protein
VSRYFYYFYTVGLLINTIFFVPRILLSERYDGSVMAVFAGILFGSVSAFLFTKAMMRFPGEGIPEIFERNFPKILRIPLLIGLAMMWTIAGSIILVAFSSISIRFLSPETNPAFMLMFYCAFGCYAASFRPTTVLNMAELIILLNLPFVAFIMYKLISSPYFEWDSIQVLADYVFRIPSLTSFAAATYPFTGYISLALYNRLYEKTRVGHLWILPTIGTAVMLVSYFVPIGLLGIDSVDHYIYTWITAVDTLRMKFGFIDRALYLFLFMYIGLSLIFIAISWNVGSVLVRDAFGFKPVTILKVKVPSQVMINAGFAIATFLFGVNSSDKSLIEFVSGWLNTRLAAEILLVIIVIWLSRREVKHA